jgi:hypothetical protein
MSDDDKNVKKDVYIALMAYAWNPEATRHWNRHNIFLVVNTGLFAVVLTQKLNPQLMRPAIIFGLILSILWTIVNIQGRFWQNRFYNKLGELEQDLGLQIKIFQYEKFKKVDNLTWWSKRFSIDRCSVYFSMLFVIAWVGIFIYSLFP